MDKSNIQDSISAGVKTKSLEGIEQKMQAMDKGSLRQEVLVSAKNFKTSWIAKYGKWEDPEVQYTSLYSCLRAALQQAGSLDTDKVADVIGNGLKYEGPTGAAQMISRPDMGNNRTVDSVTTLYFKQIKGSCQ